MKEVGSRVREVVCVYAPTGQVIRRSARRFLGFLKDPQLVLDLSLLA